MIKPQGLLGVLHAVSISLVFGLQKNLSRVSEKRLSFHMPTLSVKAVKTDTNSLLLGFPFFWRRGHGLCITVLLFYQ